MDDVLTRLLAVEKEADALVAAAESEAEAIREAGRLALYDEREAAQRAIETKVREVIEAREKDACARRDSALQATEGVLADWEAQFVDDRLEPAVAAAVAVLKSGVRVS